MKPAFDVNIRAVYGMRTIGSDHTGLEKLCGILNLPKPITIKNFNNMSNTLRDAVAENSMNAAARELRRSEMFVILGVSVDGSWQRRRFSSVNGIVAALSINYGKVIDIEPMSRYRQECSVNTRQLQKGPLRDRFL